MVLELKLEPNRREQAECDAKQGDCIQLSMSGDQVAGEQGHPEDRQAALTSDPRMCASSVHLTAAEAEVHRQLALRGRASVSALPVTCLGQAGQVTGMMQGWSLSRRQRRALGCF